MDIKDTEQPPTTLYYLLLQTTTEVITMLEIQLGVTDWLSESSSIILTEKKKWLTVKGIDCQCTLNYALSYPLPLYFPITLEEP